jgi:hypothetical protein
MPRMYIEHRSVFKLFGCNLDYGVYPEMSFDPFTSVKVRSPAAPKDSLQR